VRLSALDLDVLNRAALELYEHHDLESLYAALPGIARRAISADYFRVLACRVDLGSGALLRFRYWESDPRIDDELRRQFKRWHSDHPFVTAAKPTGNVEAVKLTDFYTDRQFRETALHREFYRRIDIGRLMGASLASGPRLTTISLTRHLGGRDFNERDRTMLSLLRRHFNRARRNAARRWHPHATQAAGVPLTCREAEVAHWLSRGKTNPEIATILAMRPRTVEKHVERILAKLGAGNRTEASLVLAGRDGDDDR
jgi:DNA-binding CsgD family transcriptional regulator